MSDAGSVAQPSRPGLLDRVPAGRLWLAATLLLFVLLLGLAAWLWWFRMPPVVTRVVPAVPVELAPEVQAQAAELTRRIEVLDREVSAARTAARSLTCPPGQWLRQGALPAAPLAGAPPAGPVATDPLAAAPMPTNPLPTGPVVALPTAELAERLEMATALVLSEDSLGTGFFVAPNLLVTNRHVIEEAAGGEVFIASRSFGGLRPGVVLRTTAGGDPGSADLALVRLLEGSAPAVLELTDRALKLSPVVAAGYPGLILQNDTGFRRLIAGDAGATPDLNLTQGVVQSVQESPQGVPVLVHTASVLQGNSGGPLVDACGRVVGINTFIAVDTEQSGRVSYAQTTGVIAQFLNESGAGIPVDTRTCPQS